MKKLLLLFITTSFVLSQNLIEDVSEKYKNGAIKTINYYQRVSNKIVEARQENYYENGQIENEKNYKDGKLDGKWTENYKNGKKKKKYNYKDGKEDGKWTSYYENGQLRSEGNFKDGKLDGKWNFYNKDGSIR